ncbi:hypothetical protein BC628DRAFT_505421 [Trametes gibbosa]|nr:hypothetical protein BC628DRAFT_505421 [Trametes gibbosa]
MLPRPRERDARAGFAAVAEESDMPYGAGPIISGSDSRRLPVRPVQEDSRASNAPMREHEHELELELERVPDSVHIASPLNSSIRAQPCPAPLHGRGHVLPLPLHTHTKSVRAPVPLPRSPFPAPAPPTPTPPPLLALGLEYTRARIPVRRPLPLPLPRAPRALRVLSCPVQGVRPQGRGPPPLPSPSPPPLRRHSHARFVAADAAYDASTASRRAAVDSMSTPVPLQVPVPVPVPVRRRGRGRGRGQARVEPSPSFHLLPPHSVSRRYARTHARTQDRSHAALLWTPQSLPRASAPSSFVLRGASLERARTRLARRRAGTQGPPSAQTQRESVCVCAWGEGARESVCPPVLARRTSSAEARLARAVCQASS